MKDEDILKAARDVSDKTGEYEKNVTRKSVLYAGIASIILIIVMIIVEMIIFKKPDLGKPALIFLMSAVMNLYEGRKIADRKMFITGVIEALLTVIFLILYIGAFFE